MDIVHFFYSVAQHSLNIFQFLKNEKYNHKIQLYGLLFVTLEEYQIIKNVDNIMLKCEAKILMSDWKDWCLPYKDINIKIKERKINHVEKEFKNTASILLLAYKIENQ